MRGSDTCQTCHEDNYNAWKKSRHSSMIQDAKADPSAIVGPFEQLPVDADFQLEEVAYTVGGKFKQRYMLRSDKQDKEDYVLGNYQWNVELQKWQPYHPYRDWYQDAFPHDNKQVPTSRTCDGCHFTGFMSREVRVEPAIACESCHGPGQNHVEHPSGENIYKATRNNPTRTTEICLQCHMRNIDHRLQKVSIKTLFGEVRDYPLGFEPGRPLAQYKTQMPHQLGEDTSQFYANGIGRKNRMQGNDYVKSAMYKHGITCVNCHNPHRLDLAATQTGDAICMKCHTVGDSLIGPHKPTIQAHTHHKADSKGSSCIECHMPKTARHTTQSPITVRTHVFGFISPRETRQYGTPNACTNCHEEKNLTWAEEFIAKWGMQQWK